MISWTDPKSQQLLKPGASSPGRAGAAHQPRGLRPAPPRVRFPSPPASDSDGLGLGFPAATREHGPAGPARRRPALNPTSCGVGPGGPPAGVQARSRTFVIGLGMRVRSLGGERRALSGRFPPTLPWGAVCVLPKTGSGRLKQLQSDFTAAPVRLLPKASRSSRLDPTTGAHSWGGIISAHAKLTCSLSMSITTHTEILVTSPFLPFRGDVYSFTQPIPRYLSPALWFSPFHCPEPESTCWKRSLGSQAEPTGLLLPAPNCFHRNWCSTSSR